MQLRKHHKAPRRFDDESFDNPERIPHHPSPPRHPSPPLSPSPSPRPAAKSTRIRPSLQPKIIEFNPNLPPAAFPTLDSWLPKETVVNDLKSTKSSSVYSSSPSTPTLVPNSPPIDTTDETLHDLHLPEVAMHGSQDMDVFDQDIGQGQPPWTPFGNSMMTSEEAFAFEMQTSEEDEPSETMPRRRKRTRLDTEPGIDVDFGDEGFTKNRTRSDAISCPKWEELSAAHQIDLVLVLANLHGTTQHAMENLRLNRKQRKPVLDLINQRMEHESTEKSQVDALQQRLNYMLLDGNASKVKHVSQDAYRTLATEYLYKQPTGEEFYFSTAAEFAKAARYLESCGHQPHDLLDHWQDEFGARAVSRFPAATRSDKKKLVHLEKPGHSKQEVSYPETSSSPHSPQPPSPQPPTSVGSSFNPSIASGSEKVAPNRKRKSTVYVRPSRRRSQRKNGLR